MLKCYKTAREVKYRLTTAITNTTDYLHND